MPKCPKREQRTLFIFQSRHTPTEKSRDYKTLLVTETTVHSTQETAPKLPEPPIKTEEVKPIFKVEKQPPKIRKTKN